MAATETTSLPLGFIAPEFNLTDVRDGKQKTYDMLRGSAATVVVFICNHCPYVIHMRQKMVEVARDFLPKGVRFIAISSNDVENYPDDSPELMKQLANEMDFPFPYLYDETQDVAKAYDAACTPDFSVFDANDLCVYRGQFDDSRPKNDIPPTGRDLIAVLNCLIDNTPLPRTQKPSLGCNIKWKK